jgi:hypothetical protein
MKLHRAVFSLLLLGAFAGVAPAAAMPDQHITGGEVARFDEFLDRHPAIDRDLRRDPRLVDNNGYVRSHPELAQYLRSHPEIRQDLRQHPDRFMRREPKYDRREARRENKWMRKHWR